MNIKIRSMLAIALLMVSFQVNAQCDCDQPTITQHQGFATFSSQVVTIVNFDGAATTYYNMCVVSWSFQYSYTRYSCGGNSFEILTSFLPLTNEPTAICDGSPVSPVPSEAQEGFDDAYNGGSIAGVQDWFKSHISIGAAPPTGNISFGGACYTLVQPVWGPNVFCPNAVIGETAAGPIMGRLDPPVSMYVPCQTFGCCTQDINGAIDPSGASCGAMDATKLKWESPCGTFFAIGATTITPCEPSCGAINVNKMASKTNGKNSGDNYEFMQEAGDAKFNSTIYSASLVNSGNTIRITSVKDVKQINVFDLNGKKTMEYKNLTSKEIDFSNTNTGIYLVQIVKTDNRILPAIKIQK